MVPTNLQSLLWMPINTKAVYSCCPWLILNGCSCEITTRGISAWTTSNNIKHTQAMQSLDLENNINKQNACIKFVSPRASVFDWVPGGLPRRKESTALVSTQKRVKTRMQWMNSESTCVFLLRSASSSGPLTPGPRGRTLTTLASRPVRTRTSPERWPENSPRASISQVWGWHLQQVPLRLVHPRCHRDSSWITWTKANLCL